MRSAESVDARFRHRPVQRVLPVGRRLPGGPRPAPRGARAGLVSRARRPRPRAARRSGGRPAPRAGRHRGRARRRSHAGDGDAWLRDVRAVGAASATRCSTPCSRPSRRCGPACGCCAARGVPGASTSPGSACSRCAAWPARSSAAKGATAAERQRDAQRRLPGRAGSALFGWLLAMLGQDVGFPVPAGWRAGRSAAALRRRAESLRRCRSARGAAVTEVVVSGGRAVGVRLADGDTVRARHAVLADVAAPALYRDLVGAERLPAAVRCADLAGSSGTTRPSRSTGPCDAPIPWTAPEARRRRARCTSASTTTASSTSRPTCRWAGCRSARSCCSGR